MFKSYISAIFPVPIYQSKLNRDFTKKELVFVNKNKNPIFAPLI